jgi:hypothetical protein
MNLHPIYTLVIASLMVPAVALALMADRALAAEPQMPESFHGTWCSNPGAALGFRGFSSYSSGPCDADYPEGSEIEITATEITAEVNHPAVPMSCVVRQVTKFDVCPWGMIYKNRERARTLRSFQINPWSAGYHIVLRCTSTSKRPETIGNDWLIEKGTLQVGDVPRNYRCPWDRRGAR